jgi:endonuclease III
MPSKRKRPHDIPRMFSRIRDAIREFPEAAMFDLAARGYEDPFQQLVACIISIRTLDEVSLPTSIALLKKAATPRAVSKLSVREIDALIGRSTFHESKARQIREIALRVVKDYRGKLPCDAQVMLSFKGVGPKCAKLAMGIACGAVEISVDVHVNRVTGRWGYTSGRSPQITGAELEAKLPREHWVEINRLLVPFGKHICTGRLPKCSTCPVLEYCQQVGVTAHR